MAKDAKDGVTLYPAALIGMNGTWAKVQGVTSRWRARGNSTHRPRRLG